jgi:hypothetical protein
MGGVNQDLLAQLAPAHAPAPAPWWPLAPGWWVLVALLLLALAVWGFLRHRRGRPQQRVRVVALHELERIAAAKSDDATFARDLEHLLRRYAVTRFGRTAIAQLNGDDWLAFLAAHGATALGAPAGAHFLQLAFGGRGQADRAAWLDAARAFLKDRKS